MYANLELDESCNVWKDSFQLYFRLDHYKFPKQGIPVTFFFSGFQADDHKVSD